MEQLRYIIEDSTIAEILGVQNFSTKESAVLELVKNAYDAHAQNLRIVISDDRIIVSDDGVGMNRETLDSYWMHIGKTSKDYMENGRVMAGSKGIGRFAMARLGKHTVVNSYRIGNSAIRWTTNWNTSNVETVLANTRKGTTIQISELRDRWTKREISKLAEYLSRSYADDQMRIEIEFDDTVYVVPNYFEELDIGKDYVWKIEMNYHSAAQQLNYVFNGDEFLEKAQQLCSDNISWSSGSISIADEFAMGAISGESDNIVSDLRKLGDFSAVFYFQSKPYKEDIEKFLYKRHSGLTRKVSGIVLYRNAFSIAGYEGKRDWLELGKRSRKSPAAASHPTGAWRVRENQIFGKVDIDKRENYVLSDLSNRQGMEENIFYELFVDILTTGIACFERYRQSLVRSIDKKNQKEGRKDPTPLIDQFLREPTKWSAMEIDKQRGLAQEILEERKQAEYQKNTWEETEQRYKYDIRLLNTLATLGLRSTSMAHEMYNDRSSIVTNSQNIIRALKFFGYWEELNSSDKTRLQYRNIPKLLEIAQKVETKMVSFMDVMLTEVEKQKFHPKLNHICSIVDAITKKWAEDYSKLSFDINMDQDMQFYIAEDIITTILDNLILNSIQQNSRRSTITITICSRIENEMLWFSYSDDGVGLIAKYRTNPMRILEAHETSRENGHGLGMWIVNNSINYTRGEVLSINGDKGFQFDFILGSER